MLSRTRRNRTTIRCACLMRRAVKMTTHSVIAQTHKSATRRRLRLFHDTFRQMSTTPSRRHNNAKVIKLARLVVALRRCETSKTTASEDAHKRQIIRMSTVKIKTLPINRCALTLGYLSIRLLTIMIAGSLSSSQQNNSSYCKEYVNEVASLKN